MNDMMKVLKYVYLFSFWWAEKEIFLIIQMGSQLKRSIKREQIASKLSKQAVYRKLVKESIK